MQANGVQSGGFRRAGAVVQRRFTFAAYQTLKFAVLAERRGPAMSIRPRRGALDDGATIDAGRQKAEGAAWLVAETR
jgi:hypothetical protein